MTAYRIAPHAHDLWKIQRKGWFFWRDLWRMTGPNYYERVAFDSAETAEKWIEGTLFEQEREAAYRLEAKRRKATIPPRRATIKGEQT